MKFSADNVLSESEALDWGRYLAVDEDGSSFVFKKEPQKLGGRWFTRDFPKEAYPACFPVEGNFESGTLYRKEKDSSGEFWYGVSD
jgi:hypothetical protein